MPPSGGTAIARSGYLLKLYLTSSQNILGWPHLRLPQIDSNLRWGGKNADHYRARLPHNG